MNGLVGVVVCGELDDDGRLVELMQGRGGRQHPLQSVHHDGHRHLIETHNHSTSHTQATYVNIQYHTHKQDKSPPHEQSRGVRKHATPLLAPPPPPLQRSPHGLSSFATDPLPVLRSHVWTGLKKKGCVVGADLAALVLLLGGGVGPVEHGGEEQPRLDGVLNRLACLASLEPLGVDGGVVAVVVVPGTQQAHAAGAGCTRTQTKALCTVGYGTLRGDMKRGLVDMGIRRASR